MRLNENGLKDRKAWEAAGYQLPAYDRDKVMQATKEAPFWIHFGAGNIFRAFQANVVQTLLNNGVLEKGLIAAEGYDYEIIEKMNRLHDDYSILVTLKSDGTVEKTVVGSVVESLTLDSDNKESFARLKEIFRADSLQMATFTITEKGYSLADGKGKLLPDISSDMEAGPKKPASYLGKVVSLLYERYLAGGKPIAMVSMDNCSHNGDKLYTAVKAFANAWADAGLAEKGFADYADDPEKVSFPWTMIDKITPRPDQSIEEMLEKDGVEEAAPIVTGKHTFVAPFVNAEECEYLVIEDSFPNGRPALEKGGFIFTDRETVDKVEKMKVCTCLNPLHTALAVFGCLLGYQKISDEMKDPALKKLVEIIGYKEGLPVVTDPGIIKPEEFLRTVLEVRIPNPFMPDTPQRIATDTSQKLPIRFGETIRAYESTPSLVTSELKMIPLVFAGWLRYLMAVDDNGEAFQLSPDPMLDTLCPILSEIKLSDDPEENKDADIENTLRPILQNAEIFGVNLYDVQLTVPVCCYFAEMLKGKGAVRKLLDSLLLS